MLGIERPAAAAPCLVNPGDTDLAGGATAKAWIVSPRLLVAQAVSAALASVGSPVDLHAWNAVVLEADAARRDGSRCCVVVVYDHPDVRDAVDRVARLTQAGDVRVVVVTPGADAVPWGGLLDRQGVEVVTNATSVARLDKAVRLLLAGTPLMEAETRLTLMASWKEGIDRRREVAGQLRTLSPQQQRVLQLLAAGYQVSEVAELLDVARATIRTHVKMLRDKLGARSQLEAVALYRLVHDDGGASDRVPRPRSAPADEHEGVRRR